MATLRDIKRRIKSVKNTQQITKAMEMVAAAKLRRAQGRAVAARPYARGMEEMLNNLAATLARVAAAFVLSSVLNTVPCHSIGAIKFLP